MTLKIRTASSGEIPTVIELWEASVRSSHHFITESDISDYRQLLREVYLPSTKIYCLVNQSIILGFIGISARTITQLFIHPFHFRQGLGAILLDFAIHQKGATQVAVNEQNNNAYHFYKTRGFQVTQRFTHDGAGKAYPVLAMSRKPSEKMSPLRWLCADWFNFLEPDGFSVTIPDVVTG